MTDLRKLVIDDLEIEVPPQMTLLQACEAAGQAATIRMQPGYDHSYYFISTFMANHLEWHAARLKA